MTRKLAIFILVMIVVIAGLGFWGSAHSSTSVSIDSRYITQTLIDNIYANETGGKQDNLIIRNNKEAVCSLGLGHFIWYPEAVTEKKFKETFPTLLVDLQKTDGVFKGAPDVVIPSACPWASAEQLQQEKSTEVYRRIYMGLTSNAGKRVQVNYMVARANEAIAETALNDDVAAKKINELLSTEWGTYDIVDYVNFKGNNAPGESYGDFTWGFKTAIRVMSEDATLKPEVRFQIAVETLLEMRVEEAKKLGKDESSFLAGWLKRVNTYSDLNKEKH